MKNYAEMSDFEINKEVASKLYDEDWWHKNGKVLINRQGTDVFGDKFSGKVEVDYCNNPADAWYIIVDNCIGLQHFNNGDWQAHCKYDFVVHTKNPLRSAMIVYLMMKDEEQ